MTKGSATDPLPLPFDYGHEMKKFGDALGNFPEYREVSIPLALLARHARRAYAAKIEAPDPGLDPKKIAALPRVYCRVTGLKEHAGKVFWVSRMREDWA